MAVTFTELLSERMVSERRQRLEIPSFMLRYLPASFGASRL